MNELFTLPPQRPTTQAADGLPRWSWTVAEIERMDAAGFFTEYDQFELLGGEIVPMMSPAGRRHETIRLEVAHRMARLAPDDVMIASEPQFNLGPDTFLKPDILVHPHAIKTYDLRGADAWLLIEVAETSLNAATLMTTVHRRPSANAYADTEEFRPMRDWFRRWRLPSPYRSVNLISIDRARRRFSTRPPK
jgi:Putative restriction endonuclease